MNNSGSSQPCPDVGVGPCAQALQHLEQYLKKVDARARPRPLWPALTCSYRSDSVTLESPSGVKSVKSARRRDDQDAPPPPAVAPWQPRGGQRTLVVIVGAGHHSAGGVSVLKPAVAQFLKAGGYSFEPRNQGAFDVLV